MKKFILLMSMAILSFGIITESWAESWNCGATNKNGEYSNSVICTYDEETKTLTIEGDGEMGNYGYISSTRLPNTPWADKEIIYAKFGSGVTSIGERAFENNTELLSVSGLDNIKTVGYAAFFGAKSLKSIDLPNVEKIGGVAFCEAINLEYAGIPNNVSFGKDETISREVFGSTKIPNCNKTRECGICNDYVMSGTGCVSDCGAGYLGKDGRCIDSALGCGVGYRQFENWCNRIRYTPAEAAKVLKDDNNNSVTITFKK